MAREVGIECEPLLLLDCGAVSTHSKGITDAVRDAVEGSWKLESGKYSELKVVNVKRTE